MINNTQGSPPLRACRLCGRPVSNAERRPRRLARSAPLGTWHQAETAASAQQQSDLI